MAIKPHSHGGVQRGVAGYQDLGVLAAWLAGIAAKSGHGAGGNLGLGPLRVREATGREPQKQWRLGLGVGILNWEQVRGRRRSEASFGPEIIQVVLYLLIVPTARLEIRIIRSSPSPQYSSLLSPLLLHNLHDS
jgi:hypothetical protein